MDPGVKTGIATREGSELTDIASLHHNYAFDYVNTIIAMSGSSEIHVVIEDARKRKWFGCNASSKQQGAGAIKMLCGLWEEWASQYSDNSKIHIVFIHPVKNGTKLDSAKFKQATGWEGRTNEHSRDAGVIAWTYNPQLAKAPQLV